ncbi:hypothetical protein MPSEU_000616100 [Mayamaea pseudoterrestris]|nr:hypothetical protein MPSEU_000616100 [Mayamaea pseudoterrestris]
MVSISRADAVDQFNDMMNAMAETKAEIEATNAATASSSSAKKLDKHDQLLSQAIEMAIEQGRGWSPGEKEDYLKKILDDDFIPPYFAGNEKEMEETGLTEAFTSLIYDGESPTSLMLQFRKKGNDAYKNGKLNQVGNLQWFRDALNHYLESLAWAEKIVPLFAGDYAQADTDDPTFTPDELADEKSKILSNIALMHCELKNWGMMRDDCKRALECSNRNTKAWFRLAKAQQMMHHYEAAGDAIDKGLALDAANADLLKLRKQLEQKIQRARKVRQQRERARAERQAHIQRVWKHCQQSAIKLGRVPLVASTTDEEEDDVDADRMESQWHQHLPNAGKVPQVVDNGTCWTWPCMFLYPSHRQSDFIERFDESEMLAVRMAQMFPELEETDETTVSWDFNNEFVCSQLAVYFEIHGAEQNIDKKAVVHPESVQVLQDQSSCMRFYEACRALRGDEGEDIGNVVRAVERRNLHRQRQIWTEEHGSLWAKPKPNSVVRVHPAMTLRDVLVHSKMVVSNFIVTFIVFPEDHPSHAAYLKEHDCVEVLQPAAE